MSDATSSRPQVNGILETSLYVPKDNDVSHYMALGYGLLVTLTYATSHSKMHSSGLIT